MNTSSLNSITLMEYNRDNPISYLWFNTTGCQSGTKHTDKLSALIGELSLWEMSGNVVADHWEWDGCTPNGMRYGSPKDSLGNSILNITAG